MHGITVIDSETAILLRGHGLDHAVVYSGDEYEYAIEVERGGEIDEIIRINDMFHHELIAEKIWEHHKRFEDVMVTVRDTNNGVHWRKAK